MKPLHGEFKRLRRCPCCQSKYSTGSMRKQNDGKSAARGRQKIALKKEISA